MYDIAIIGAGPAGATLARLLAGRYRVLLVDRRRLDVELDPELPRLTKCCGGLVAPDAQKVLAELGLGLPASVLVGPQLFAVRTIDLQAGLERFYQRFYINVDREKLDNWLVSLLPSGVETRLGAVFRGYEPIDGGIALRLEHGQQTETVSARLLVGADGASSLVRRRAFGHRSDFASYIAIQEWFEAAYEMPYYTAIFDPGLTDFYAWTIPKGNRLLVGAALQPGPQAQERFTQLKERLQAFGLGWGAQTRREGAFIVRPRRPAGRVTSATGIALIGEAAGWISPSSAEGLSYAFTSAIALARSLEPGLDGALARYERTAWRLRVNLSLKLLKSPAMYQPWLRRLAMGSGVQSVRVLR